MVDLGCQCPEICLLDYEPLGVVAWSNGQPHAGLPVISSQVKILSIDPLKATSHGDTYAQQSIIANLFTQHVSEVEQNTLRVD